MPGPSDWNELVPIANRFDSPNKNARRPASLVPSHIVIHVTGDTNVTRVKRLFMAPKSVSAHYLVTATGEILQFVPDAARAWHAGIDTNSARLYRKGAATWQRYLRYFGWYKGYPPDAIYVDGDTKPVWDKSEAAFVARADGSTWAHYDYFRNRWKGEDAPVNFATDPDPNNYAIGIETMGVGSTRPDSNVYTDAMYESLRVLVSDLSAKYKIPMKKGRVVGHEDVHPIARFGWDPNQGFDWSVVHKSGQDRLRGRPSIRR